MSLISLQNEFDVSILDTKIQFVQKWIDKWLLLKMSITFFDCYALKLNFVKEACKILTMIKLQDEIA